MATVAIGDIHGNLAALKRLIEALDFDPRRDRLWFVGDLVNRGPDSLGTLRYVRGLGASATVVLGNHDLSLMALAQKPDAADRAKAGLQPILTAPDGKELLDWLRHRPLIHSDESLGWTLVHAGIPAEWTIDKAHARAAELEAALQGPRHRGFLRRLFGNTPDRWADTLTGIQRLRYIANALTRQRFVMPDGQLDMTYKTTIAAAPKPLAPWFALPDRASANQRIVFGHWSALEPVAWPEHNVWGIDTGASWGGRLTALRLDGPPKMLSVPG